MTSNVHTRSDGNVWIVTIDRPHARNAVDALTADALSEAFRFFDQAPELSVAVLHGAHGTFCAGADLKAISTGENMNRVALDGDGPMGPTRMHLCKPVIAAIEGHAVAGGLELALWCDLRVAARDATFGVFCRRFGVPLIDGGTIRLPRIVGMGRAMDMILTGRPVLAPEALEMGLINRMCATGTALDTSLVLAHSIAALPQQCMRSDRLSAYEQWNLPMSDALTNETRRGIEAISSGELFSGTQRFARGEGRHGS